MSPTAFATARIGVKVEPGATLVKGPSVAETFPVSVGDSYIVVEM